MKIWTLYYLYLSDSYHFFSWGNEPLRTINENWRHSEIFFKIAANGVTWFLVRITVSVEVLIRLNSWTGCKFVTFLPTDGFGQIMNIDQILKFYWRLKLTKFWIFIRFCKLSSDHFVRYYFVLNLLWFEKTTMRSTNLSMMTSCS